MDTPNWPEGATQRALQFWEEYQKQHDTSALLGQAVGIDPNTGEVWFGKSASEIASRLREQGIGRPLLFLRVGSDYYQRKMARA